MKNKKVGHRELATILILVISAFVLFTAIASATTIYVPEGGNQTIQQAVNNATAGDIIIVRDGTYTENVLVNKSLTVQSENVSANCIVQAANSNDHVFYVTVDYVNISWFTVQNATGVGKAGIYLSSGVEHCNISNNNASYNYYGIYLHSSSNNTITNNKASYNDDRGIYLVYSSNNNNLTGNNASYNDNYGIYLYSSSNNNLTGNNASYNGDRGIYLDYSSNNNLTGNNASYNGDRGIYLYYSSNNTLTNNTMSGNKYNFCVRGSTLSHYIQDIDTSNKVETKPIYYWVDQKDQEVPSDAGFVGLVNSTNITVRDSNLTKNYEGVLFVYTNNSRIENVKASNNYNGIYLYYSSNNNLTGNTASYNNNYGIYLYSSSNNTLTNNTCKYNQDSGIYLYHSDFTTIGCDVTNNGDPYDDVGYNMRIRYSDNVIVDDVIVDEPIQGEASSCPFLYTWNGDEFEFVNEIELGILGKYGTTGEQLKGNTWEKEPFYVTPIVPLNRDFLLKIGTDQLVPLDGKYELRFAEELDELNYADLMELWTVDHAPNVDVYVDWTYRDNFFTVEDPVAPLSAIDHNGEDVLSLISAKDWDEWISEWRTLEYIGKSIDQTIESNYGGYITLTLGDWTEAPENLKLVITENRERDKPEEMGDQFKDMVKYFDSKGVTKNERGKLWDLRGGPRLQIKDTSRMGGCSIPIPEVGGGPRVETIP